MKHVFISYKREDISFVNHLTKTLINAGIEAWSDSQIRAGEKWRDSIDTAIAEAFALVVVMTPAARQSEYVTYEWAYAMGLGIEIIPILLKGETKDNLHPKLEERNYLDFRDRYGEPWKALTERLLEIRGKVSKNTIQVSKEAPVSVRNAVNSLDSSSTTSITEAVRTLAKTNHPDALKALCKALEHPNKDVSTEAFNWLFGGKSFDLSHDKSNPLFFELILQLLLHTEDKELRRTSAYQLASLLRSYDSIVITQYRSQIINSLYREEDHVVKSRLLDWVSNKTTNDLLDLSYWIIENEKDSEIFAKALSILTQSQPSNLTELLRKRLTEDSYIPGTEPIIRKVIIDVLSSIRSKASVDVITLMLDDDRYITVNLDNSLGNFERQISRHARLALEKINTDYAQQRLTTWRETADPKKYIDEDRFNERRPEV